VDFKTHDSLSIEKIVFLKKGDATYALIDLNDDLNINNFNEAAAADNFRMMMHLYPEEKDLNKVISKLEFINQDFKPNLMDMNGNKFLFYKLENKTSSDIDSFKFANFTFYSDSKGRGNVLTLYDLQLGN
jgi:hypothetical protein